MHLRDVPDPSRENTSLPQWARGALERLGCQIRWSSCTSGVSDRSQQVAAGVARVGHRPQSWVALVVLVRQTVGCSRHQTRWVRGDRSSEAHCQQTNGYVPARAYYPIGHSLAKTTAHSCELVFRGGSDGDQLCLHGAEDVAGSASYGGPDTLGPPFRTACPRLRE